ncbi:MAG: flavodoxin-dependent (E)-4-hydroxy-3-methylbut-2-enyl-diphosphate synthase [Syntrophomonadaceae bacterium]|nr:flavodoxin-dependent (E)-4-hydroxy-3-methylbut-2-enyl-diphosphate synthase [Syntrophomonadaceae bacterium]MDD3022939.1 flavodoxin-dependent (E)-4-hydroxy-3-methylbut-2-enyl-diphosphate synthase [Syntrophomonadaceae bacterium]
MKRKSRELIVGNVSIGGNHPIVVQSMTNTDTRDVIATVKQIKQLEAAGCEIVRVAIVDSEAAHAIKEIKKSIIIPLIADIHFDYRLAVQSVEAGADGLRINPGNIGESWKVKEVVKVCQAQNIPIRIGVNAGSLDKKILEKYKVICAEAMVESALQNIRILEDMNFKDIKASLKSSSVILSIEAYRMLAKLVDYPLHVGITEAGTKDRALIKSALGIGMLLYEGIGDTIRVSLTADPVDEVWAAYEILRCLGLRERGIELISCPSCGRCEIDLISTAEKIDRQIRFIDKSLKIAVMGCVVNGPGEAKEADLGIAGGRGFGLLFKNGEIIRKVPEDDLVKTLLKEIEDFA